MAEGSLTVPDRRSPPQALRILVDGSVSPETSPSPRPFTQSVDNLRVAFDFSRHEKNHDPDWFYLV